MNAWNEQNTEKTEENADGIPDLMHAEGVVPRIGNPRNKDPNNPKPNLVLHPSHLVLLPILPVTNNQYP